MEKATKEGVDRLEAAYFTAKQRVDDIRYELEAAEWQKDDLYSRWIKAVKTYHKD